MRQAIDQFQIVDFIVELVAVLVVDLHSLWNVAFEVTPNEDVFSHLLVVNADAAISFSVDCPIAARSGALNSL